MDSQVTLRPVTEDDLSWLASLSNGPAATGPHEWHGWTDPGRTRRHWAESGLLGDSGGMLIALHGADRVGEISWRKVQTGPTAFAWAIGIGLAAEFSRIEATTEITNAAEQRALEKAGFTREGVLRGTTFRQGRWHDQVIYSVLRNEVDLEDEREFYAQVGARSRVCPDIPGPGRRSGTAKAPLHRRGDRAQCGGDLTARVGLVGVVHQQREAVVEDGQLVLAQGGAGTGQHGFQVRVQAAGRAREGQRRGGVHPAAFHDVVDLPVDGERSVHGLVRDGPAVRGDAADVLQRRAVPAIEVDRAAGGVLALRGPLRDRERLVTVLIGGHGRAVVLLDRVVLVGTVLDGGEHARR